MDTNTGSGEALQTAIHAAMRERGYRSQATLATAADVAPNTLTNWFHNRSGPDPEPLERVAERLDVSAAWLMDVYRERVPPLPLPRRAVITPDILDELEERIRRAFREELRGLLDELRGPGPGPEGAP